MNERFEPLVDAIAERVVERLRGGPPRDIGVRLNELRNAGLSYRAISAVVALEGEHLTEHQIRRRVGEQGYPRSEPDAPLRLTYNGRQG